MFIPQKKNIYYANTRMAVNRVHTAHQVGLYVYF